VSNLVVCRSLQNQVLFCIVAVGKSSGVLMHNMIEKNLLRDILEGRMLWKATKYKRKEMVASA